MTTSCQTEYKLGLNISGSAHLATSFQACSRRSWPEPTHATEVDYDFVSACNKRKRQKRRAGIQSARAATCTCCWPCLGRMSSERLFLGRLLASCRAVLNL